MNAISPQLRAAINSWLTAANDLAARKVIRKHVDGSVHETIQQVLGVKTWPQAMKARQEARKAARVAAKAEAKKSKVSVKKAAKKPASKEGRLARAA